jgi:hypothetical protein
VRTLWPFPGADPLVVVLPGPSLFISVGYKTNTYLQSITNAIRGTTYSRGNGALNTQPCPVLPKEDNCNLQAYDRVANLEVTILQEFVDYRPARRATQINTATLKSRCVGACGRGMTRSPMREASTLGRSRRDRRYGSFPGLSQISADFQFACRGAVMQPA